MKISISFAAWTARDPLEIEIPDDTPEYWRLRTAAEKAVSDGASLDRASLDGASLIGASLDGARLDGASLDRARLDGASLNGASLIGASLDRARLIGASLDRASLIGANLDGASLNGARLRETVWRGLVKINRAPLYVGGLAWPVWILDNHMQIGCELHTLNEWRGFDCARIARMDGVASRKFWKQWRDPLLAMAVADGRGVETAPPLDNGVVVP